MHSEIILIGPIVCPPDRITPGFVRPGLPSGPVAPFDCLLTTAGHEGQIALEAAAVSQPDMVLLGLGLLTTDGHEKPCSSPSRATTGGPSASTPTRPASTSIRRSRWGPANPCASCGGSERASDDSSEWQGQGKETWTLRSWRSSHGRSHPGIFLW
jgi:hypothetical protein